MESLSNYICSKEGNLLDLYIKIGDDFIKEELFDESILDTIKTTISKLKDNSKQIINAAKDSINKISPVCKSALDTIKSKAGKTWDKIKDLYTAVISLIDSVLQKSSKMIKAQAELYNKKIEDIENILAYGYLNIISSANNVGEKIFNFIIELPKTTKQLIVLNTIIIAVNSGVDLGIDTSIISDTIDAISSIQNKA